MNLPLEVNVKIVKIQRISRNEYEHASNLTWLKRYFLNSLIFHTLNWNCYNIFITTSNLIKQYETFAVGHITCSFLSICT